MYKYAHFVTYPFNLIVDIKSLNKPLLFEFENIKFRLKPPYKSYPYNHDFSHKPLFYLNNKGIKEALPIAQGCSSYPMYNDKFQHIGIIIQQKNVYSFDNSMNIKLNQEDIIPKSFNYSPTDTIRFDTNKKFNNDSPKFLSTFFSHLRILSEQFWINKPRTDNEGVSLEADIKLNENLTNFQFHSNLIPIIRFNKGIVITYEIWKMAIENTINNVDIDFSKSLYLDAIYERTINNTRAVVLSLSNSLDIRVNMLLKKISNNESNFDRNDFVTQNRRIHKKISSTYIPWLIGEFLESLIDRNYQKENMKNYEVIKNFWLNHRNVVAHGSDVNISDEEMHILFETIYDLLKWLEKIEKKIYEE